MKTRILFATIVASLLFSCTKDKTSDDQHPIFEAANGGVYISNEGKYTSGNASVSYYGGSTQFVVSDAYNDANHEALGDVCQSMTRIGDLIYIVVNNSGKIVVANTFSFVRSTTITGFTSPRYLLPVSPTKAYVSDLYSNSVNILNLTTNSISGSISIPGSTEAMLLHNGLAYVTNVASSKLYVIDIVNDNVIDSISVCSGGNSICKDKNGKIWVLGSGDFLTGAPGGLTRVDPTTATAEMNLTFDPGTYPSKLCINTSGDSLYFINSHVYKMSISDTTLPASPFIVSGGRNFYGMAYDSVTNILYVSDPIDFLQRGRVYRFSPNGNAIDNFAAGIAPGDFLFLH